VWDSGQINRDPFSDLFPGITAMLLLLSPLDVVLTVAAVQLTVFIVFLILRKNRRLPNTLLAVFLFSQLAMVLSAFGYGHYDFFYSRFPHIYYVNMPFFFLVSPVLYFFVRSLTVPGFSITQKQILHFIPFACAFLYFTVAFYVHPASVKRQILDAGGPILIRTKIAYVLLYYTQILIYNVASLKTIARFRAGLKQQYSSVERINLSWLRFVIYGFIAAWLVDVFHFTSRTLSLRLPMDLLFVDFIVFLVFYNVIFFKGWTHPQIFITDPGSKYRNSLLTEAQKRQYLEELEKFMKDQKPYLDPLLTLPALSRKIHIPPRYLSQILNESMKQNFFDYINSHRIEESKRLLRDKNRREKTVLEVLLEVGFNSKSSFNSAFKRYTGMTPTSFMRSV
jgi:AraC-like DNA-binding protein